MRHKKFNFRKYEKTFRVMTPNIETVQGTHYHSPESAKRLLCSIVELTEKIDGANVAIYKDFHGNVYLQKRGSHLDTSHEQYIFFQDWVKTNFEKVAALPPGRVYYMELMRCKHSIYYDKLDDWVIMFKVWDMKTKRFLEHETMKELCDELGLVCSHLIYKGVVKDEKELESYVPKESQWGDQAEGIVIFNPEEQMLGKVVWPKFKKMMDQFWRNKPIVHNKRRDGRLW